MGRNPAGFANTRKATVAASNKGGLGGRVDWERKNFIQRGKCLEEKESRAVVR